jgi:type IX secretion system PorP/SprF family membrane protein
MKKISIGLYLFLIASTVLKAQSYHFSQFFSTPLLTNPGHTGFIDGPYRVASNFRTQAMSGGSPYFTGYVSADVSPFKKYLPAGHKAGLGMYVMNDKSLSGALQTNSIGMSAAYNVGLDKYGVNTLGLGIQGTYNQRRVDFSNLTFGNQFGSTGYNPSLPIGETLPSSSDINDSYFDVNAGIIYNALMKDKAFFVGASVYNIVKHQDNFLSSEFKMPTRYMLQAGSQFKAGEEGNMYFSLTHMGQAKANETIFGGAYGLQLTNEEIKKEITFGAWYRLKDALIPYVGYYNNGFRLGLSYDYTVSSAKTGAEIRNAYELTLLFSAIDKLNLKTTIPWY